MSTYRLQQLFAPRSIAIVGASPRERSIGGAVLRNLRAAEFPGPLYPVNPNHKEIDGLACVASLGDLASAPDLVMIATPAETVPGLVAEAGAKGIAVAVILSDGLGHGAGSLAEKAALAARAHGLRLVGPNSLGVIAPLAHLNASLAATMPPAGDLAVISQSGTIAASLVEWGARHRIGFSGIVSVGEQIDIDFGDLLDYFALQGSTRAILLYIESIQDARKFMSAARAAARTKPVVVIKSGRHAPGAQAAATHSGALAGADAVYDAAFRRAGLLRVIELSELFDCAETLGRVRILHGNRLAVLTNGGGLGVLAIDRLTDFGGRPAQLSPQTMATLDAAMPECWSRANPVDIGNDADAERYVTALRALLDDPQNDAVLVLNVQTALTPALDTAKAVADLVAEERSKRISPRPVLVSWIDNDLRASETFRAASIPHFPTAAEAVRGFAHLVRYQDSIRSLMETPPSLPEHFTPDDQAARNVVRNALAEGRAWLNPLEVAQVLEAYDIPCLPAILAPDADAAGKAAASFLAQGHPVVVKIASRDIVHKSDIGGVRLNIASEEAARKAAADIIDSARQRKPDARIEGVVIQPMVIRPKARELIAGIADDPVFGPVIVFGRGGTAAEVIDDKALALPPLDLNLANDLIARTRVSRRLESYRNVPAAKQEDVALALVKLAQLAADIPEIRELDINPLLADDSGVLALDARIAVSATTAKFPGPDHSRFALRPYPRHWERHIELNNGQRILVRPVRPEDETLFTAFFPHVTTEDLRLRFFAAIKDFGHAFIAKLTQIDYGRAMAFIAIDEDNGEMMGAVRLHSDANYESGEYAVLLRSNLKGLGLGWKLMQLIIEYAGSEGLKHIEGQVLKENTNMLRVCRDLGFSIKTDPDDQEINVVKLDVASANIQSKTVDLGAKTGN